MFAAYQKSLHLTDAAKKGLTADTMLAAISSEIAKSAETYMNAGKAIADLGEDLTYTTGGMRGTAVTPRHYTNDWIDVDNATRKVLSINMERYLAFVATQATLKATPAFDQLGISTVKGGGMGESTLFGAGDQRYSNFTAFSWNRNDAHDDGIGYDDTGLEWAAFLRSPKSIIDDQVKLINPMQYIGTGADTAPYWYVRHGTRDRDTSFVVSINLSRALAADRTVRDVNYRLSWNEPHSGNYDVPEAMQWIAHSMKAAKAHGSRR